MHCKTSFLEESRIDRQQYQFKRCRSDFDDLSETIFAREHQWFGTLDYLFVLMRLNLFNLQISQEVDLNQYDTQKITYQLYSGIVEKKQSSSLTKRLKFYSNSNFSHGKMLIYY